LQFLQRLDFAGHPAQFIDEFLSFGRIVPEPGSCHLIVDCRSAFLFAGEVKESPGGA
jgi:hypothetical protein